MKKVQSTNYGRIRFFFVVLYVFVQLGCNNTAQKHQPDSLNTETKNNSTMEQNKLKIFGEKYAKAWCSQQPDSVAAYFSINGSLSVNGAAPAVGRIAIAKTAQSFMTAFPDMIVRMDRLVTTSKGIEFHWTLTGTNSVAGGTGNKVHISGVEIWQFDSNALINESKGSFDAAEYDRQLNKGVKK